MSLGGFSHPSVLAGFGKVCASGFSHVTPWSVSETCLGCMFSDSKCGAASGLLHCPVGVWRQDSISTGVLLQGFEDVYVVYSMRPVPTTCLRPCTIFCGGCCLVQACVDLHKFTLRCCAASLFEACTAFDTTYAGSCSTACTSVCVCVCVDGGVAKCRGNLFVSMYTRQAAGLSMYISCGGDMH